MIETLRHSPKVEDNFSPNIEVMEMPLPGELRRLHLETLPNEGFGSTQSRSEVIEKIDAVGFPVDNFRKLSYKQNEKGSETTLGSWGIGKENSGEFSVYAFLKEQHPEKQLGTIAHESMHANSPLVAENAFLYGSEENRQEAAAFVTKVAEQSLISGKFINGYHSHLAKQLVGGEIDYETFVEETSAITAETALTNRKHLAQVQEAQQKKITSLQRNGLLSKDFEATNIISTEIEDGNTSPYGIDKTLVTLIHGVEDYEQLIAHSKNLKDTFYPEESRHIAQQRASLV